jgi:DDB1- and CUL4-associated factor 7
VIGLRDESTLFENEDYPSADGDFYTIADTMHGYPATKLQWQPASAAGYGWSQRSVNGELLATVGDALRIWELASDAESNPTNFVGRGGVSQGKLAQKIALTGVSGISPFASYS